ncbi:DUF1707 domain-containing protein [Streptomyces sp. NPDC001851]|uniref:DUF1707 SHOCT-like domain-containing protein n=1 Tax=Streptomyces sp. NPDC001851 TaxID=3154529 RepID=UPI0033283426
MNGAGREPEGPPLLVSDEDRDMAVRRLGEAYAEGRISYEEMDELLHRVLTARTHQDLGPALASLPEEHAGTPVELHPGTGGARITVPRDATVETDELRTVWKQPRHRTRRHPRPGGPRIRISGTMEYGRLRIRHARR